MQKVEGVQSVKVSLKEGLTVIELRPGNRVRLAQLRTVIKNNGFVSKDAHIVAHGTPKSDAFEVSGSLERLRFSAAPTAADNGRWRFVAPAK